MTAGPQQQDRRRPGRGRRGGDAQHQHDGLLYSCQATDRPSGFCRWCEPEAPRRRAGGVFLDPAGLVLGEIGQVRPNLRTGRRRRAAGRPVPARPTPRSPTRPPRPPGPAPRCRQRRPGRPARRRRAGTGWEGSDGSCLINGRRQPAAGPPPARPPRWLSWASGRRRPVRSAAPHTKSADQNLSWAEQTQWLEPTEGRF